jgi:Holliday junction resolvase RusA-like endonuclease
MSKLLHMFLPFIPPSLSEAYTRDHRLTTEARNFKAKAPAHFAEKYLEDISEFLKEHNETNMYVLAVRMHMDWKTEKGTFKRRDISNYIKLLEDSVSATLGVDDKQNIRIIFDKVDSKEPPMVEIFYYNSKHEDELFNEAKK